MKLHVLLVVLVSCGNSAWAQFDDDRGPLPPRVQIPGAIPLPAGGRPPFRRGRIQVPASRPAPIPAVNVVSNRRPIPARALGPLSVEPSFSNNVIGASPSPPPPPSPSPISFTQAFAALESIGSTAASPSPPAVQEVPEEDDYDDDLVLPQGNPQTPSPRPSLPATRPLNLQPAVFRPTRPAFKPTTPPSPEFNVAVRQQSRQTIRPLLSSTTRPLPLEDEILSRNTPQRQAYRPTPSPPPKAPAPIPTRQQSTQSYVRPSGRPKKPVAQIIHRYREDNPDGSITWGFENDDGTFKEETIGIDCTVRGKYGYIDPDGQRREYAYTSGIPCDKDKKTEEGSDGFIDYQDNKYVLPNGDTLNLDAVVKNRARRPVQNYRL